MFDPDGRLIINAYEESKNEAEAELAQAEAKLAALSKEDDKSAYKKAKKERKDAQRKFDAVNGAYQRIQKKIKDVKTHRPDIYEAANNLTDAGGNQVDVYVFEESHEYMQEDYSTTGDGEVFGKTQAFADVYVMKADGGSAYYTITSDRKPGNVSIILSDQSSSKHLSHEFGHTIYQTKNMKEYIEWLKAHPDEQGKGGHGKGDPSGAAAKEAENGF